VQRYAKMLATLANWFALLTNYALRANLLQRQLKQFENSVVFISPAVGNRTQCRTGSKNIRSSKKSHQGQEPAV